MRYVALLRGINVGGKTLLNMSDLRACLDGVGLDDVCTYIASGNVLFESGERDATELEKTIETAVERRFQLPVNTVVFDRVGYARIVQAIPASWIGYTSLRANVAFARRGIKRSVVRALEPDPAIEQVKAIDRAILWATKRDALNRSVMRRLIGGAVYKEVTVRSVNTTLKLHQLLAG